MKRIKIMVVTLLFLPACLLAGCGKTGQEEIPPSTSPSVFLEPSVSSPPFIIHQTPTHGGNAEELIYDAVYFLYYLGNTYSKQIFIEFPDGRTVPLREALEKEFVGIDELMENGLDAMMDPVNPELGRVNFLADRDDLDYVLIVNSYEYKIEKHFLFFTVPELSDDDKYHLFFEYEVLIEYLRRSEAGDVAEALRQYDGELVRVGDKIYLPDEAMAELGIAVVTWDHTQTVIEV
jgi:hypothetical protein